MAKCKYCGQDISRLEKEICPHCGGKNPLDVGDMTTQDITQVLGDVIDPKLVQQHSKIVTAVLAILLGFMGMHNFYLNKFKTGLITLGISVFLIGGIGTILFVGAHLGVWAYLIPYFAIEALMIVVGISYIFRHDVTDGFGNFLK